LSTKLKTYIPYVFSIAALAIFATYLYRNAERYHELLAFSSQSLLFLVGLALMFSPVNGIINLLFYKALGVHLTLNEGVGLAAVNTLANQLPLAGGLVAKGVYLKQKHELTYIHFLSATMALYVCFVAANGAVALVVLGYWTLFRQVHVPFVLVLSFSGMMTSIISLWLPMEIISIPGKIGEQLRRLAAGWKALGQNFSLIGIISGFQILTTLLFAGRFWIAFHMLSQDVSFSECILFAAATVLTRLVSFAPGGLGVREGIVAGVASLLGFDPGISAVAVGIDRLVATSVIIVLGTIYTYILSKKVTEVKSTDAVSAKE